MTRSGVRLVVALLLVAPLLGGCDRLRPKESAAPESTRALALRVRLELLTELGVDGTRVEVDADGGRVRLGGEVRKRATAELAASVAQQVEGVVSVENEIRVAADGTRAPEERIGGLVAEAERELADAALETRVRLALVDRLGSDGFRIGTEAASGTVTLALPRELERPRRREAVRIAERVEGVRRVVTLDRD